MNKVYWHEFDEPQKTIDPISKKEVIVRGMLRTDDERVDKIWFYGATSAKEYSPMEGWVGILFKDGNRYFHKFETDKWESESEEFLKSIK